MSWSLYEASRINLHFCHLQYLRLQALYWWALKCTQNRRIKNNTSIMNKATQRWMAWRSWCERCRCRASDSLRTDADYQTDRPCTPSTSSHPRCTAPPRRTRICTTTSLELAVQSHGTTSEDPPANTADDLRTQASKILQRIIPASYIIKKKQKVEILVRVVEAHLAPAITDFSALMVHQTKLQDRRHSASASPGVTEATNCEKLVHDLTQPHFSCE